MSYGVMGGQYQPIGQAHVLQNIYDFDMNMQEAIDAPRTFALNGKLKIEGTTNGKIYLAPWSGPANSDNKLKVTTTFEAGCKAGKYVFLMFHDLP